MCQVVGQLWQWYCNLVVVVVVGVVGVAVVVVAVLVVGGRCCGIGGCVVVAVVDEWS